MRAYENASPVVRMRVIVIRWINDIACSSTMNVKQLHFLYKLSYFRLVIVSGQIFVNDTYCMRANVLRQCLHSVFGIHTQNFIYE